MKRRSLILAAVIALLAGLGGYQLQDYLNAGDRPAKASAVKNNPTPETVIGMRAADFSLFDTAGARRHLSEWRGKVVALNFWATWCPPCREEIPYFVELQDHYMDAGLQFVGVALHEAEEVRDFLQEFKVNYPSLVGQGEVIALAGQLGNAIGALPYTVILDRNGRIAFTRRGPLSKAEAEAAIQNLLQTEDQAISD